MPCTRVQTNQHEEGLMISHQTDTSKLLASVWSALHWCAPYRIFPLQCPWWSIASHCCLNKILVEGFLRWWKGLSLTLIYWVGSAGCYFPLTTKIKPSLGHWTVNICCQRYRLDMTRTKLTIGVFWIAITNEDVELIVWLGLFLYLITSMLVVVQMKPCVPS